MASSRLKNALAIALADPGAAKELLTSIDDAGAGEAVDPSPAITNLVVTATTGSLPTANGTFTMADLTTAPTKAEFAEVVIELNAKLVAINAVLAAHGLTE